MKDLIQCAANHNDFKRWLELGHAPLTVYRGEQAVTTLTRLEKTSSVDYLYQIPVAKDNSISWNYSLTFCGVYERRTRALYLTEDSLKTLMKGTYPFIAEAGASVKNELCGKINQRVEDIIANDRKNLLVQEIQCSQALRDLQYYREHGAQEEAIKRFFDGNAPDGQFHSSYTLNELPEAAFLDYIQDPEGFIQNEAERLIKMNQEQFLLQFLKNDALLMKYEAVMQDTANPIHRVKAISEAIKISGAKSVNVTVQKDGEELSFKTGTTPLRGRYNSYSSSHIAAADRQEFERLFGRYSNYSAEDIIRITYGKKTIYEAAPAQCEGAGQESMPEQDTQIGGMTLA